MTIAENPVDDVIRFWFEELVPNDWFVRNASVDERIRQRFLSLNECWSAGMQRPVNAREALAAVIVLDQFPRNLFRGSARAFATDSRALALAQESIASGWDRELPPAQRMFLYMPFQHAEDRAIQARSVELFATLGGEGGSLDYAIKHKEVVDRFGRFPHRNAALGRPSTAEEAEFMEHHPGF